MTIEAQKGDRPPTINPIRAGSLFPPTNDVYFQLWTMRLDRITMLIKLPPINSVSKFSAVCALAFVLLLSSANLDIAKARDLESRAQAVDRFTDWFFYKVNPQLGDRKLRSDDSAVYIREWNAIRSTVDREMITTQGDCVGDAFWDFDYRSHGRSLDRIADTIWTIRDPSGDKTRTDVSKKQWKKLRQLIFREHFCY